MSLSENDQDNVFTRHFKDQAKSNRSHQQKGRQSVPSCSPARPFQSPRHHAKNDTFKNVSWPILLAVIPTLGAFFAVLYYVHKWMTVPWAYYESARSRRIVHQKSSTEKTNVGLLNIQKDEQEAFFKRMQQDCSKRKLMTAELRRHELAGLLLVVLSPVIAGYTLQYSRYLLSSVDRYISEFNVAIFILAASIKPLTHVITLLQQRTIFLQTEALNSDNQVQVLEKKLDLLEKDFYGLQRAFATKQDLGQVVAEDINPSLQQLATGLKRSEKRDLALRKWYEEQFAAINHKFRELDQYVYYHAEQKQRQQAHGVIVSLILLPFHISLWVIKRLRLWLPVHHNSSRNLLAAAAAATTSQSTNKSPVNPLPVSTSATRKPPLKHQHSTFPSRHHQMPTAMPDPTEASYSTEGSIAAFGH
ncbi:hypothetical protein [Parasitella parasitica]|uniref:Uncharacterized protein n=1 Tax=Parasitella parasitica TaxID=35722 RepID=A0A0B7NRK8_9FUNG|nr:hypothetical protein [Parasitella parasitica]